MSAVHVGIQPPRHYILGIIHSPCPIILYHLYIYLSLLDPQDPVHCLGWEQHLYLSEVICSPISRAEILTRYMYTHEYMYTQ